MTAQIRLYIELGAAAVLILAFGLYTWHERDVGAEAVHTADAQAQNAARRQAEAETLLNTERATKAEEQAASAQKAVDDYRAANPIGPVSVCHADHRQSVLPATGATVGNATAASPGPAAVPQVSDGTPGPDISAGLSTLVSVASSLAERLAQFQQRQ